MPKTKFKNTSGTKFLEVEPNPNHLKIYTENSSTNTALSLHISKAEAPAMALAFLEAAGWPEDDKNSITHQILKDLQFTIDTAERRAQEAKEQKALEAVALALFHVAHPFTDYEWAFIGKNEQKLWLEVAKKAKTLYGGTK